MVLAATGKAFSAGGDFNWVLTWPSARTPITRHGGADAMMGAVQAIYDLPQALDRARPWRGGGRRRRPDAGLRLRRRRQRGALRPDLEVQARACSRPTIGSLRDRARWPARGARRCS